MFFTYWNPYDAAMPCGADQDGPTSLERELQQMGVRAASLSVDLSHSDCAAHVLNAVQESLGAPTILVNNAAYSTNDGFRNLDAVTLDAHYAVNVRATCLLSVEFARRWRGQSGGRIICLTSGQSLAPMPNELAYVASKGAIEAFAKTPGAELGSLGITVNAVNPGPTDTGWMTEALKSEILPRFALGRIGEPEDAARLVAFLASDEAAWITGQVIHSHGGFRD